jgi:hypothetical protein
MNPEVALQQEEAELCNTAIDTYVNLLQLGEAVDRDELQQTLSAAIIACDALSGYTKNGWHRVLRQECAARGVTLRRFTKYEKHKQHDTAYATSPNVSYAEGTITVAIQAQLKAATQE